MRIMSCLVAHDDGTSLPYACIEYEGKLWLVTGWLTDYAIRLAVPERMIRLDLLRPKPKRCSPGSRFDYEDIQLPKAVVEGHSDEAPGFEVRHHPGAPVVDSRELKPLPLVR